MKNIYFLILSCMIALLTESCKKPYTPPAIRAVNGYLVVEGVINPGNDSTMFMLSHTVNLDSVIAAPVAGAQVTIEGTNNTSYALTGNAAGVYKAAPLNLDNTQQYRLHIINNGEEYVSDYVGVKVTPPIDTVNYTIANNGLQITLNTHDPTNNTRYYRWSYMETWAFHVYYNSQYVSNGDTVLLRPASQQVFACYAGDPSTSILLGSSAKLTQDVIAAAPITFVPSGAEKLEEEYSILVKQYALTSDAYNFWANLKKNTEQLGSIFDAQPSQINGNIHCLTNPSEPVIGYVSASTVQSKRIFVNNNVLPQSWQFVDPYGCHLDSILFEVPIDVHPENQYFNYDSPEFITLLIPIIPIFYIPPTPGSQPILLGHFGTYPECGDCTTRGTTVKPSYWP